VSHLTLIKDVLDVFDIASCERVFEYMESRSPQLCQNIVPGRGKSLVLLKICNGLLKRLSRTEQTVFCGKILTFLSKTFSISERSAINIAGSFNLENVTKYEGDEGMRQLDQLKATVDKLTLVHGHFHVHGV
jgi:THO complex subunit 1